MHKLPNDLLRNGVVTIPPGDYALTGTLPILSGTTVFAYGARFHLPEKLGDQARVVAFAGENVTDFTWHGGAFFGQCFDHRRAGNTWEPNANTRIFAITTTPGSKTDNLLFRDIHSERVAGAVINVEGVPRAGSESAVDTFATNIAVRDCSLIDSGKFMWDYGLLWQILVWPEEYTAADVAMAERYFFKHLIRDGVRMADGDDRVFFAGKLVGTTVSFYGGRLPANLVRGRMYHVVESGPDFVRIADTPAGKPLRFAGTGEARMICDVPFAFYHLYAPVNAGPGKGGIDLVCCRGTSLTGNRLSSLGDTMHIQRSHNNVFANNQILGSRMGAFFLAEYCQNSTITGNTVDGTNGSRVMSVEKSNADVTISGNTFRGGGRGSWINQPQGLILQGNVFINNTTKGERDPWRGRKSYLTGNYERWAEIYFTLHEPHGEYGPVIVRDNLFVTGPACRDVLTFTKNGHDIIVEGNVCQGPTRTMRFAADCRNVQIGTNLNAEIIHD